MDRVQCYKHNNGLSDLINLRHMLYVTALVTKTKLLHVEPG